MNEIKTSRIELDEQILELALLLEIIILVLLENNTTEKWSKSTEFALVN